MGLIAGPCPGRSAAWCLGQLVTLKPEDPPPSSITISARGGKLHVHGYELLFGGDATEVTIRIEAAAGADPQIPPPQIPPPQIPPPAASPSTGREQMAPALSPPPDPPAPCTPPPRPRGTLAREAGEGTPARPTTPGTVPSVVVQRSSKFSFVEPLRPTDGSLAVVGWGATAPESPSEAIVFIPGFNAAVRDAILAMGQLLVLGEPPSDHDL